MTELRELVANYKFQCSGCTEEVKTVFSELGLEPPKADFFYVTNDLKTVSVDATTYKLLVLPEQNVVKVANFLKRRNSLKEVYEPGEILVFDKHQGPLCAVVIKDIGDCVEVLILASGCTYAHIHKFKLHRPSEEERKAIEPVLSHCVIIDGKVDLFPLRPPVKQKYFYIDPNFKLGTFISESIDVLTKEDDYRYRIGNYFKSAEDAKDALIQLAL